MLKVAVLDDYQNVFNQIVNVEDYKSKYTWEIRAKRLIQIYEK